ncbi:MAG: hypothetical protein ACPG21_11530 [Crocinitomicaceae bacterium]
MKKLLFISAILITSITWSQYDMDEAKKEDSREGINWFQLKQKIYVGGELGLSFGTGSSFISAAPIMGYDITERFSAGISGMYQLWRFRDWGGNTFNSHTYGGGVFARLRPIEVLIMQVEANIYNTNDFESGTIDRTNVPAVMAGLGYAQPIGGRSYYHIMLMYDFINDPNMPLPPFIFEPLHFRMGLTWYLG